jgi:hypothetical protein
LTRSGGIGSGIGNGKAEVQVSNVTVVNLQNLRRVEKLSRFQYPHANQ